MTVTAVWVNGRLVAPDESAVAATDHGLVVGDGAFESVEVLDGAPFALTRHHDRLDRSLAGLGLAPLDRDRLGRGIEAVLSAAGPRPSGLLRYFVTAGLGPLGSGRLPGAEPTYVVAIQPIPPLPTSSALHVVQWVRNERAATTGLKTTSYADNVLAYAAAQRAGAQEAVFANTRGELCEGTGSNVFVVVDGRIVTPPLSSGALAGVTRELLLEWAAQVGLPIEQLAQPIDVLRTADEVFITSTTRAVHPVHRVDDRELPIGPLTRRAAAVFAEHAARTHDP